jgi:hypothetical protein
MTGAMAPYSYLVTLEICNTQHNRCPVPNAIMLNVVKLSAAFFNVMLGVVMLNIAALSS